MSCDKDLDFFMRQTLCEPLSLKVNVLDGNTSHRRGMLVLPYTDSYIPVELAEIAMSKGTNTVYQIEEMERAHPYRSRTVRDFEETMRRRFSSCRPSFERDLRCFDPKIKDVIFNNPATIVIWNDDTKTVVKCGEGDTYSKETGLAMCIAKKFLGNKGNFNDTFKKWIKED